MFFCVIVVKIITKTITNIVENFVRRGNSEAEKGGNNTRLACTDDVNVYIEYCKKLKPSIYSSESLFEGMMAMVVSVDVALSLFVLALSLLTSFQ